MRWLSESTRPPNYSILKSHVKQLELKINTWYKNEKTPAWGVDMLKKYGIIIIARALRGPTPSASHATLSRTIDSAVLFCLASSTFL